MVGFLNFMKTSIQYNNKIYRIDLSAPIDISIRLQNGFDNLTAWHCDSPRFEPVMTEFFTGSVKLGGAVNFKDIYFNPHAHCTHTECLGHISVEDYYVNELIKDYNMPALLSSYYPTETEDGDLIIMPEQITKALESAKEIKCLIIRTLPNDFSKCHKQYSNTNPPYIHPEAIKLIVKAGIEHLMIDSPSIDREEDEGKLEGHHIFWNYPDNPRYNCSISELIYVPEDVKDGVYWLQLGIANFRNDAAPSRPLLFRILE